MKFWSLLSDAIRESLQEQIAATVACCTETVPGSYLLFDRKEGNPVTLDSSRLLPVPDLYFDGSEHLAPQLLPLRGPEDSELLQEALALAVLSSHNSGQTQWVCALIEGPAAPGVLLEHFGSLGFQYQPGEAMTHSSLFRYQDPRVMQRVWTHLSPAQRIAWLGPVRCWYAALQPLGCPASTQAFDGLWQTAPTPASADTQVRLSSLLDKSQWHLAHSAPAETTFWRLASQKSQTRHAASPLPSATTLRLWLSEAAEHGLGSNDQANWALCKFSTGEEHWQGPAGQRQLQSALALLDDCPALGFTTAWHSAGGDGQPPNHLPTNLQRT